MPKDVIIACDFASKEETLAFLDAFGDETPFVKIGMELFYSEGPDIVRELKARGHKVFLDLKLHDIPNTVGKAMKRLGTLGVDITNVHAAGGVKMMKSALDGLRSGRQEAAGANASGAAGAGSDASGGAEPLLIAVTQLTSTDKETMNNELLIEGEVGDVVRKYAENAKTAGLGGVVCSPLEAPLIHEACGSGFLTVTPGIRLAGDSAQDQARVTDPKKARELGSDYIVVGRSITAAADPLGAYRRCMEEFLG